MKKLSNFLIALALLAGINQSIAQGTRYFRIYGPATTTISTFQPDGIIIWSNALPGTNYIVQTAGSLPGGTNWVDYVQIPVTNNLNTNLIVAFNPPAGMALVPAGLFLMGDTLDGEADAKPTNVYVSAFYMDVNLVDYNQWQSLYSYATNQGYSFTYSGGAKATNHPVIAMDWYDVVKWCNARSQQAGLAPVYFTDAGLTQIYTNAETTPYVNWTNNGYRLPTEAEWEKASRGGLSKQRFPWGYTISQSQANYFGKTTTFYDLGPNGFNAAFASGGSPLTSPVGYFSANGYGLYDMAGNVFEWCWDWYGAPPYSAGSPYLGGSNPSGPSSGIYRILRGGSWNGEAGNARCSGRAGDRPIIANEFYGFRCVKGL
ncbi:MAG: SUMF1/EgtB/PvdO family nonheme iron enzyme [Limisphaerales bacterium]